MFKEQIQNNNSDHDRSYLTQTPACSMQCYQRLPSRRQQEHREEAALEIPPSCVRKPFEDVVAEDDPT